MSRITDLLVREAMSRRLVERHYTSIVYDAPGFECSCGRKHRDCTRDASFMKRLAQIHGALPRTSTQDLIDLLDENDRLLPAAPIGAPTRAAAGTHPSPGAAATPPSGAPGDGHFSDGNDGRDKR